MQNWKKRGITAILSGGLLLTLGLGVAQGNEPAELEVTIYRGNLALVSQERAMLLEPGLNNLEWNGFPAQVDPSSLIVDLGEWANKVQITEQNYKPAILGQQELLGAHLGKEILLILEGGEELRGILRSHDYGQVLLEDGKGLTSINQSKIVQVRPLTAVPALSTTAGLNLTVQNGAKKKAEVDAKLSYLTGGLDWQGDYRLVWDKEKGTADIGVWATVENRSNHEYTQAKLNLVAGEVNRSYNGIRPVPMAKEAYGVRSEMAMADSGVSSEPFSIYHVYNIPNPTTIGPYQTKQLQLASAVGVPIQERYVYDSRYSDSKIQTRLAFTNSEDQGLGLPLPAGRVRTFGADGRSFLGEDELANLPIGQEAEVALGYAFDLSAERMQTQRQIISKEERQESYQIELHNTSDKAVEVLVREAVDATAQWEITSKSHEYRQVDSSTVEFRVLIPANGSAKVEYSVNYRFQA